MDEVIISSFPHCDFCLEEGKFTTAVFDCKTTIGTRFWAYLCQEHFERFGMGLGCGLGQKLILRKQG